MGKLISLEGLDSSGKSSQVKIISEYLQSKDLKTEHLHFPMYGHNVFSDMVARFLRGEFGNADEVDPLYVASIYALDRFKYLPTLQEKLQQNDVLILDRYVLSNIAFQCAKVSDPKKRQELRDWIVSFEYSFLNLPYPDLSVFLDVPINVIEQRLQGERTGDDRNYLNGKKDVHEADLDFQSRVRDVYFLEYTNNDLFRVDILASDDPGSVFEKYKDTIDKLIN